MDDRTLLGDAAVGRLSGTCILVVDDEDEVRTFLATVLSDEGAATLEASDGAEALERAARAQPDLITLDLSMPGTDGIQAFAALRGDPATAEIPVCIITGHPEFRKVLYDSAVTPPEGFLGKPCDPEHLVRTVHRIVGLQHRRHARQQEGRSTPR